jgi:hypothetical protein
MTYRHTQVGTVIIVAVLGAAFITLAMLLTASGTIPLPALVLFAMTAVALSLFSWLTVEIDKDVITCRFGVGLIRKTISLSDVDHARAVLNAWWVGWGIRWIPGRYWVWNVSGFQAVELTMKDGRRFRIGTDEPEALVHAIELSKKMGT